MKFNVTRVIRRRLGVAIDWRVRDVLEAEREAIVELGQIFVKNAANLNLLRSLVRICEAWV